jgi:hypothetical protein
MRKRAVVISSGGIAVVLIASASASATLPGPGSSNPRRASSPRISARAANDHKAPKLESRLAEVAATAREHGTAAALDVARQKGLRLRGGKVKVVVIARPGGGAAAVGATKAAGGDVVQTRAAAALAFVPPSALTAVAGHSAVVFVRAPLEPKTVAVTDEGVASTDANAAQAVGVNGSGQKVAVIDVGFSGYTGAIASGDLPGGVTTLNYCTSFTAEPHGTAVAEIVYKMAPAAQLFLMCIEDEFGLQNAEAYAKANGIKIVNESLTWPNSGRGDGTSSEPPGTPTPDGVVNDAHANGILWVNAAGNEATQHWSGFWSDPNADRWLNFSGSTQGNAFFAQAGDDVCMYVRWDDWPRNLEGYVVSSRDFDAFVYPQGTPLPADPWGPGFPYGAVAVSGNVQEGAPDQKPIEWDCFTSPASGNYYVAIYDFDSPVGVDFDVFVDGGGDLQFKSAARSIGEPASSPNALAVGAICWQNSALEFYSSQGPTIDSRVKPDISGPDSTSSAVYGGFAGCPSAFAGTSASSPHVAGAAALVWQQKPAFTAAQVQDALEQTSTILVWPGTKTNSVGWGGLRVPSRPTVALSFGTPDRTSVPTTATVFNHGRSSTFFVEYGPTLAYGNTTFSGSTGGRESNGGSEIGTMTGLTPGTAYHARLDATNDYGTTTGPDVMFTTLPDHPLNVTPPNITGIPQVGHQLSVFVGNWSGGTNGFTKYDVHFDRCNSAGSSCTEISSTGATDALNVQYAPVAADVGSYIRARVIIVDAHADNLPQSAVSGLSPKVVSGGTPYMLFPPGLSGPGPDENFRAVGYDGLTFGASGGDWSLTVGSLTTTYQWQRCVPGADDAIGAPAEPASCVDIGGATGPTYTAKSADWLHTVRVKVTATGPDGSATAYTRQGYVKPAPAPTNSLPPTINNTAPHVGQTLTGSVGMWSTLPGLFLNYTYTWRRCLPGTPAVSFSLCTVDATGSGNTYVVAPADVGMLIVLQVTAQNIGGAGRMNTAWSSATAAVGP